MKGLIRQDDWLKEVINEHDLNNWNPEIEECCTAQQFRLHLAGTPCCPWNTSAARVFTDDFLKTHTEVYPDVWAVRRMVLRKTQAYIKSLIKAFRGNRRGKDLKDATRRAKNRRERKTNVSLSKQFGCATPWFNSYFRSFSIVAETSHWCTWKWMSSAGSSKPWASTVCPATKKRRFPMESNIGS